MSGYFKIILCAALLLAGTCVSADLVLADGDGKAFFSAPVSTGDFFSLLFTHSVAKSPVEEVFEITGGERFTLRETIYADFGWGLPHEELPGQRMEFADGRIRLTGYAVEFEEVALRVGHIADHHVVMRGGADIRLADYVRPGGEVRIAIKK